MLEYSKNYRDKNKQLISRRSKEYYSNNKDRIKSRVQDYYDKNKRVISIRRRSDYNNRSSDQIARKNETDKIYRLNNKERISELHRIWMKAHPEYGSRYREGWRAYSRTRYATNKEHCLEICRRSRFRIRQKVISHYSCGTNRCACCGESALQFLSIDHVNGGGSKHIKELGGGNGLLTWLIKNGYPEGFRILCFNCNLSAGIYGSCPHQNK